MTKADCPSCNTKINVGSRPRMGQRYRCPNCRSELEVVWLEPVELDFIFDDDDEDEYDFDEDDDY